MKSKSTDSRRSANAARATRPGKPSQPAEPTRTAASVRSILASLRRAGSKRVRDEMMPRYGIVAKKAFGVPVSKIQAIVKPHHRDHALAEALWKSGVYEARLAAAFVGEPDRVTPAQMDRWCRDFDNWGVCDTVCFHLWDRTPHAFAKVKKWASAEGEFVKRTAFALLASLALHDRATGDAAFVKCLPLAERAATDGRNFVWKGVSWALRGMGMRSRALHTAVLGLADKLIDSGDAAAQRLGKDVRRDLVRPAVVRRLSV